MTRYKLTIAYDGTDFHGWQKQFATPDQLADTGFAGRLLSKDPDEQGRKQLRTVQAVVEQRLRRVCREEVQLQGSSRTDSGVHALAQVAAFTREHADTGPSDARLIEAINAGLPDDVVITECARVPEGFEPIANCVRKGYRYTIAAGKPAPLWGRRYAHHVVTPLGVAAMRTAASALVGTQDFAAFSNAGAERETTVRTVLSCDVAETNGVIAIDITGDGFLYNMVRIIAGTLVEAGRGKLTAERVREALETGDRRLAGPTLPPEGLRLEWMEHEIGGELVRSPGDDAPCLR